MTPSGQTICLCMIVRNEAPVIRRSLASVRPLIDRWLVVDTGSTDGTQAIVREALADLPGELVERPWVDFGHNRSEALGLARPLGDYTLIIDADDEILPAPGYALPVLDADSYVLDIQDAGIAYRRTQLVRAALPWRYAGVLHEFLTCPEASVIGHLPLVMRRNHDGARRRDPDTYRRDAAILEAALAVETDSFLVARYTFYLAQSYRDAGAREEAVAAYLRRAELGRWDQEVFWSLYQAGQMMAALGRAPEAVLATFARASAACPSRAEAAHAASRFCRSLERFAEGAALAEPALGLAAPPDGLFVEGWIYAYGLRDEFAVNAYWAGRHRDCLDACLTLLSAEALPAGDRARVAANARFALDRLTEAVPAHPVPAAPVSGGPLLAGRVGQALAALRARGFSPDGLLDIGAHDGHFARAARRIFPEARILMVDALAEKGPVLDRAAREIGNAAHAIALLGDRDADDTPFFVVDTASRPDLVTTGSSKFRENTDFPMEERRVPQRRLDRLVAGSGVRYGFVKLDVQGAEIEVLRGLGDRLAEVEVILLELSVLDYNEGAPLIGEALAELSAMGFVLYDVVDEHRYRDGSLLQVDGLLVRRDSPLRPRPPFWSAG